MRVFNSAELVLDVPTIVGQMDQTVWSLKSEWEKQNSRWALMFTDQQAAAADARLKSLRSLIADLDVGGVAREHVFFPLPGQTNDAAWATYREVAEYVRDGLRQVGGFVSGWSLAPTLARIGADVRQELKTDLGGVALLVGGLVALSLLGSVGNARRALSGYRRRRSRR